MAQEKLNVKKLSRLIDLTKWSYYNTNITENS